MRALRRDYGGRDDLRAMQRLAERLWSARSHCHIGDLAWGRYQHQGREAEWPTALWEAAGEVVAWGWCELPGSLWLLVDPEWPELAGEVLEWFAGVATGVERSVVVLDAEAHVIAALARHGYRQRAGPFSWYMSHPLAELPDPLLPPGFVVRPVRGAADVPARVAVHRAAWHPSQVTVDSYRDVMSAWPYRPELDWVVVAPDGRFAAYCLGWLDERNGVGELEPVGTAPEFRRRGLARAACFATMAALRAAGAEQAVVYPVAGNRHGAVALYEGIGFERYARTVTYVRS